MPVVLTSEQCSSAMEPLLASASQTEHQCFAQGWTGMLVCGFVVCAQNVENIKGCVTSILNSKFREDRRKAADTVLQQDPLKPPGTF